MRGSCRSQATRVTSIRTDRTEGSSPPAASGHHEPCRRDPPMPFQPPERRSSSGSSVDDAGWRRARWSGRRRFWVEWSARSGSNSRSRDGRIVRLACGVGRPSAPRRPSCSSSRRYWLGATPQKRRSQRLSAGSRGTSRCSSGSLQGSSRNRRRGSNAADAPHDDETVRRLRSVSADALVGGEPTAAVRRDDSGGTHLVAHRHTHPR